MSYYRRGYSWEQIHYVPAPVGGWNPDANPWELPSDQAPVLDNFLLRPGKIITRGGFTVVGDLSASSPLNAIGYVLTGNLLLARKDASAAGFVDPWHAPLLGRASTDLASGLLGMQYIDTATGVVTPVTAGNADQVIGPRWINFDGLLYGLSYDATGAAVTDAGASYHIKPTSLLTLGTQPTQTSVVLTCAKTRTNDASIGTVDWTPGNCKSFATVTLNGAGVVSHYNKFTNYGFNIPTGATITGIQVDIHRNSGSADVLDSQVRLIKAGTIQSTNKATNTGIPAGPAYTNITYGGVKDHWSTTWTPADINNAGFGVAYSVSTVFGADMVNVKDVTITVSYTYPVGTPLPTILGNAPHGAFDLKGHQQRIWLLGGIDTPGAGTTHQANVLFFTNPIDAGGGTSSADWKDPVSGLTNKILMDHNTGDFGVALATVRNGLVLLRRKSIWLLRGTTTSNYAVQPVTRETGCLDARSVIECDRGVYFVGTKGLMLTDGTKVLNVSGPAMYTIQQAIVAQQRSVISGLGGHITCGLTSQGEVLVTIGAGAPGGSIVPVWAGLYDPNVKGGAWTRITSQLWANDGTQADSNLYPGQIISRSSPYSLYVVGDQYLTMLEDLTANYSFLAGSQLYDQLPSGGSPFLSIPAVWKTRWVPIIGTSTLSRKFGQAKRFFLDSTFGASGLVPITGWTIAPVNGSDNTYASAASVPVGVPPLTTGSVAGFTPIAAPQIQRFDQDFANEINDLAFDISWSDSAEASQPTSVVAEIFGVGVEYQPTRDLR